MQAPATAGKTSRHPPPQQAREPWAGCKRPRHRPYTASAPAQTLAFCPGDLVPIPLCPHALTARVHSNQEQSAATTLPAPPRAPRPAPALACLAHALHASLRIVLQSCLWTSCTRTPTLTSILFATLASLAAEATTRPHLVESVVRGSSLSFVVRPPSCGSKKHHADRHPKPPRQQDSGAVTSRERLHGSGQRAAGRLRDASQDRPHRAPNEEVDVVLMDLDDATAGISSQEFLLT